MGHVFNRETNQHKTSVDTPKYKVGGVYYDNGNWIINPTFVPNCESKYMIVEGDTIREMSPDEKAVVDYVPPPPEPTPEELTLRATEERRQKIDTDIRKIYPYKSDELQEIRMILAEEFPNNERAQAYNTAIEAVLSKYPKEWGLQ